jgi:hypothetical protein
MVIVGMIKKIITIPIRSILKLFNLYSLYSLRSYGHLKDAGWFKSFKTGMPVDNHRNPIPWFTYSALYFIEERIHNQMNVFEYGCGNSTLWWSQRVRKLVSCEHDCQWFEKIKKQLPRNVELYHVDLECGKYAKKIAEYWKEFDIIVIDGRDRVNCAKNSLRALKEDGVIIWDNSDRDCYKEGCCYLEEDNKYKRIDFKSIGAVVPILSSTSIFYKDNNCLGI